MTGVFSFHGSKTLTTGEGGMLTTDSDAVAERVRVLRDHGRQPGDTMFRNTEVAWKYKMSSLQAALGLAQLERLAELVEAKRRIFGWYREELSGIAGHRVEQRTRRRHELVLDGYRDLRRRRRSRRRS